MSSSNGNRTRALKPGNCILYIVLSVINKSLSDVYGVTTYGVKSVLPFT